MRCELSFWRRADAGVRGDGRLIHGKPRVCLCSGIRRYPNPALARGCDKTLRSCKLLTTLRGSNGSLLLGGAT